MLSTFKLSCISLLSLVCFSTSLQSWSVRPGLEQLVPDLFTRSIKINSLAPWVDSKGYPCLVLATSNGELWLVPRAAEGVSKILGREDPPEIWSFASRSGDWLQLHSTKDGVLLGLRAGGLEIGVIKTNEGTPVVQNLELPVFYPIKSFCFGERVSDQKQYLFALSHQGDAITQMEVKGNWKELIPVRTIFIGNELLEMGSSLLFDGTNDLLYVVGHQGRLVVFSGDPGGPKGSLGTLQIGVMPQTKWDLLNIVSPTGQKSIALFEKESMRVLLWKQNQKEGKPTRILQLNVPSKILCLQQVSNEYVAGVDAMGKIKYFMLHDFLIE